MSTFGQRVRAAMARRGLPVTKESKPGAALYNLWIEKYGLHSKPRKGEKAHIDYITRPTVHKWLRSDELIPSIDAHKLMRLGLLLETLPRWLLHGGHLGPLAMEMFHAPTPDETHLMEVYRQIKDENAKKRVIDRAQDVLAEQPYEHRRHTLIKS